MAEKMLSFKKYFKNVLKYVEISKNKENYKNFFCEK